MRLSVSWAILLLALGGLIVSVISLAHKAYFVSGAFCTFGTDFNCDIVNRGAYSEIFGVPVAVIGIVGYGLLVFGALVYLKQPQDHGVRMFLFLASAGGLAFSVYLTGLEAFVLHAWCTLCLTSQAIILSLFFLTLSLLRCPKPASDS